MAGRLLEGLVGQKPPYHAPTFVLTHYEREPLVMEGGTTFYFVTGGIEEALERAKKAAGERDIKIGGGVSTVRQYLKAGLIDSVHLASAPVLLGRGELLFEGLDLHALGFSVIDSQFGVRNAYHTGESVGAEISGQLSLQRLLGPLVGTE
jgi:dihydrofolate reductase